MIPASSCSLRPKGWKLRRGEAGAITKLREESASVSYLLMYLQCKVEGHQRVAAESVGMAMVPLLFIQVDLMKVVPPQVSPQRHTPLFSGQFLRSHHRDCGYVISSLMHHCHFFWKVLLLCEGYVPFLCALTTSFSPS